MQNVSDANKVSLDDCMNTESNYPLNIYVSRASTSSPLKVSNMLSDVLFL